MLTLTTTAGGKLKFHASIQGLPVYLDNDSLIEMAKGDPVRRQRFLAVLRGGGDLMFSVTNAIELSGPQGRSADAIREFLDEVGPHWFPVELDTHMVLNREIGGMRGPETCLSTQFTKDFYAFVTRPAAYPPGSGRIIPGGPDMFKLGAVLDWMQPQRESLVDGKRELDEALINRIAGYRDEFDRDSRWLDEHFPEVTPFRADLPMIFIYSNLIRALILDAKAFRLKKGDGVDFCHAVIATAFARAATLDKQWKRRVDALPKPNDIAKIFYRPELDLLVASLEVAVARLQARDADR